VVWQWWAPELWRRFTIALPRVIAKALDVSQKVARRLVRVSFAKVGEYQQRGIIHFHAIIRLDGPPDDEQAFPPPRIDVESGWLADRVHEAAGRVEFDAPPAYRHGPDHRLTFGTQVDARPVHVRAGRDDLAGPIHPETVAAYIAKYSTKSAADLDPGDREVAEMLGYGESKVWMLVIQRDLKSLKDGGSRRILPEWVDEYIARRAAEADRDSYDSQEDSPQGGELDLPLPQRVRRLRLDHHAGWSSGAQVRLRQDAGGRPP